VVVTQGTDTIEETAYLLDLLLALDIPVVVTGAMRNPGKPGEDGPANLVGAVRVAAHPDARGCGVLVMLDDTIHLARFVRKTHTSATGAFASQSVGPIGYLVEDRVRIPLKQRRRSPHFDVALDAPLPDVGLLTQSLGNKEQLIEAVAGAGYRGLVVETFGAGHVAVRTIESLANLAKRMPVVFASRTGAGELYQYLGQYPGSEGDLLARGLIGAVGLDGLKARLLLTLLLATGASRHEMVAAFDAAST
jgi:L-asparaginase